MYLGCTLNYRSIPFEYLLHLLGSFFFFCLSFFFLSLFLLSLSLSLSFFSPPFINEEVDEIEDKGSSDTTTVDVITAGKNYFK